MLVLVIDSVTGVANQNSGTFQCSIEGRLRTRIGGDERLAGAYTSIVTHSKHIKRSTR